MRTLLVIAIGLAVGLVAVWLGQKLGRGVEGLVGFAVAWLVFCGVDTYIGVVKAGYGLREELIIHAGIFTVPVLTAWAVWHFFLSAR